MCFLLEPIILKQFLFFDNLSILNPYYYVSIVLYYKLNGHTFNKIINILYTPKGWFWTRRSLPVAPLVYVTAHTQSYTSLFDYRCWLFLDRFCIMQNNRKKEEEEIRETLAVYGFIRDVASLSSGWDFGI